jgi:hypothetical protein
VSENVAAHDPLEAYRQLSPEEQAEWDELLTYGVPLWIPQDGKQTDAWESAADIIFYGGAAGGGKSELLLGTALMKHERSIIFRREGVQLQGLVERMSQILGTRDGFNGFDLWRIPANHVAPSPTLEFGAMQKSTDWMKYQGRPHDFIGFDEITHFTEMQFRQISGWLRTDSPDIKQQVICAGNPPTDADGEWVIRFWAPWLDPQHPNPAKSGELRWFISNEDGEDEELPNRFPVVRVDKVTGKPRLFKPKSRTFIRSSVHDNAYLMATGYADTLNALPEPFRSQMLHGEFMAGISDPVHQLIPTLWIKAAQARWVDKKKTGGAGTMTALGFDPARGGLDKSSLAPRYGNWFDKLVTTEGINTSTGALAAAFMVPHLRHGAPICVDGIGIGTSVVDKINEMGLPLVVVIGSEGSTGSDKTGKLRFKNTRAEMYWRLREALDPAATEPLMLPPDQELLSDLAAVKFKVVPMGQWAGIQIRSKDEIREALGRSPDKGDAVAMTFVDIAAAFIKTGVAARFRNRKAPDWRSG